MFSQNDDFDSAIFLEKLYFILPCARSKKFWFLKCWLKQIKGINFSPDSEGNELDRLVCLAGGRNSGGARRGLKQRRSAEEEDSEVEAATCARAEAAAEAATSKWRKQRRKRKTRQESALEARVEAAEGTARRNRLHGARVERRNCGAQIMSALSNKFRKEFGS
ncbi:hypothetical protein KSP40_PGU011295 [Platanthera guangdongensis]|uniref:Uncharacterized protein n=1 Tax=Platanthera guangdongensis TaxID=2320717 RepID=A0ABR2MCX2_9ASPA